MDYIERLIRRAFAVPRDHATVLFDPFEQVAPWALNVPASTQAASTVMAGKQAGQPESLSRSDVSQLQGLSTTGLLLPEHTSHQQPGEQPMPMKVKPVPVGDEKAEQKPRIQPTQDYDHASLSQADVFMRSLGVNPAAPEASVHMYAAIDRNAEELLITPTPATARAVTASLAPVLPVMVRPAPPSTPVYASPAPSLHSDRAPSPAQENNQSKSPSRRAAPHPVPERIVQTTVVVAPSSHRLDDLAHSSSISRFGIGQF